MYTSLVIVAAIVSTVSAQSATSLTFWNPGPANNPSVYSKNPFAAPTTFPPVASIISSNPATTVFALGCPTQTPGSTPSSIFNGKENVTCTWATDYATYTIINSTHHVMHLTDGVEDFSAWWTCDYNTAATRVTCDMEIAGNVNDNTGGPLTGLVWPDERGNVVAFATAEVVTQGRFGELDCGIGDKSSSARACNSDGTGGKGTKIWSVGAATGLVTASGSAPAATATQGSGAGGVATGTASGSVAAPSTGMAVGRGVDGFVVAALVGAAAFVVC